MRESGDAARAEHGAFRVAPDGVAGIGVAAGEAGFALLQAVFVLGMERHTAGAVAQNGFDAGIVLDQEVAGGGAGKNFDAADAGMASRAPS